MLKKDSISIVIPNWNGRDLLAKNLNKVLLSNPDEIIVSDDGSSDGSIELLKESFPNIKLHTHHHVGFGENCNIGVCLAKGDIIVLLNTDVVPSKNFLDPLKKDFKDPKVFAISLFESQWSWGLGRWKNGIVEHEPGRESKEKHISFWASGGSGAFRKKIWEELEGFDSLYAPFYWEDIDLSYRAWKRGYKIIWEPKSIVEHQHAGTIGSCFPKEYIETISQRNQLLFVWKNITDSKMIKEHIRWLLKKIIREPRYLKIVFLALFKFIKVMKNRSVEKKQKKVKDREIFDLFEKING